MRSTPRTEFDASGLIAALPRPKFLLRHHIREHSVEEIDGDLYVLPYVAEHQIVGGVGNIVVLQDGEPSKKAYEKARRNARDDGWTYIKRDLQIPAKLLPPSAKGDGDGYSQDGACADPKTGISGTLFLTKWYTIEEPETRNDRSRLVLDRERWKRFRCWLVEKGVLAPASPRTIRRLEHEAVTALGNMQGLTNTLPTEARERVMAVYDEQLERIRGAKVPAKGGKVALTFAKKKKGA